ncbi:MAG: sigma 54-interacting transcriptional regulator, partial [Spirochaetia bacterium]|nr:sigma 54-interacting transcriptional regulator [Spirochaetia bacterium]
MIAQDIMSTCIISLNITDTVYTAKEIFKKHNFSSIPILDVDSRLIGVVRLKDLLEKSDPKTTIETCISSLYIRVKYNVTFNEIIEEFFTQPDCAVALVLDESEKLIGIISKNDMFRLSVLGRIESSDDDLQDNQLQKLSTKPYLQDAFNSLDEGIIIIDNELKVQFANKAYMRILGVQPHHILNKRLSDIEPNAKIIEVLKTGKPFRYEDTINVESVQKTIVANIMPIIVKHEVKGAISSFFDKTQFHIMANQLEKLNTINDYLEKELKSDIVLPEAFSSIIGSSKKLKNQLVLAWRIAETDSSVLILGESGTGKELVAQAIHKASMRKENAFVAINCSAIPDSLIESELFGYEEGAFTGAIRGGKAGKIEKANKGTMFFDEIGDMPLFMQPRLLRFLQEKEYERIGGTKTINVDVRVIAATNKNLEEMVAKGEFRKDLFYRINTFTLEIPPLREHKIDILALIQHFLDLNNKKYGKETMLSNSCINLFLQYDWPGNIREVEHVIEHAVVLADDKVIKESNLPKYFFDLV